MIRFLLKGLMRDRSRSLFPFLTVFLGVLLTVVYFSWVRGMEGNILQSNAKLNSGHVNIMTRAYAEEIDQKPNDLALLDVDRLLAQVRDEFPLLIWTPRIRFGGLLDVPDEQGETKEQGPVIGLAVDLLGPESPEPEILDLGAAVVRGRLPVRKGEILVSDEFASRLGVQPGAVVTLISSTMYGSMGATNFSVAGTLRFGVAPMDRGTMLADIEDIRWALDMEDGAGEILGFFREQFYDDVRAEAAVAAFNSRFLSEEDEFSPVMDTLLNQSGMGEMMGMIKMMVGIILGVFIFAMSIVLWNTGLMGNIRRYGEIGVRLAMGEEKGGIYRMMIAESLLVGILGTLAGTAVGLAIAFALQSKGINVGSLFENASILMDTRLRAQITPGAFVVGFIPGLLATFLGAAMAGRAIFKRQTSRLIKELEA